MIRFEKTKDLIRTFAHYALPLSIHSIRRGNDREVTCPQTRDTLNKPEEIGYLLRNISEEERKELSKFTAQDLADTQDGLFGMGIINYIRFRYNATKKEREMMGLK